MPRKSSVSPSGIVHDCKLQADAEEDVLAQIIDTGIFINLRRKLLTLSMVNRDHPRTQLYYKSGASCRREGVRHLVNYMIMSHPFCLWCLYWEFFIFWVYSYMYLVCSLSVAFLRNREVLGKMNIARLAGDFVLLIDMIHLFFMGYYCTEKSRTIMNPIQVAKHYLATYFFVDLISSVPSYCEILKWLFDIDEFNNPYLSAMRLLSIFKVFRIGRWLETLELYRQYMNYSSYWFKAIKAVLMYLVLIVLLYAAIFTVMNFMIFTESPDRSEMYKFERFYKATMILLVVSHGDNTLISTANIAVVSLFLCVGYVMQLFLYAEVMQVWNKFESASNKNDNLLQQFKEYMKYKGLPIQIREKMFTYFNFKFQNEFFNEAQINSMVSDILKQEILMHVTKIHLEKAQFFKGIPETVLMKIVSQLKSEIYLPDDVIVTAGTPGTCMYFIYFGTVAVYTAMGKEICHLEDGAHFGEIALVFNEPRIATVVAVTPCELFKLKRTDFLDVIEPFAELKTQIVANARERLLRSRIESF
ncbi:unnamed protein product [Phaedon cochleariae]|uniref:Cyclic nucleotide-binding domain-containing protein n=1 Tax=Phaedon cochleariae TaxID=80249 RepID=A0A9N9S7L4_PHACE|nr:unnamed protein product [Phaedon cochleariae]